MIVTVFPDGPRTQARGQLGVGGRREAEFASYDTLAGFFRPLPGSSVDMVEPLPDWRPPRAGDLVVERRSARSRLGLVVWVGRHPVGAALGPVYVVWSPWGPRSET